MTVSNNKSERMTIGLILCIALLTFFSPLVSLRLPIGDQRGDAPNIRAGLTLLRSSLGIFATLGAPEDRGPSTRPVTETLAIPKPLEMPLSLRYASLPPWLIFAALACAALALLDLLSSQNTFAGISLAGGCFGALAVLHVLVMSSDLKSWTAELISSGSLGSPDNPVLATRMFMLNTFHVNPGPGLYLLTTCLFLVPFLSYTRAIPRVRSVVRRNPRANVSQPILIRPLNSKYPEETCTSLDLSRNGLYVESDSNHYYVGMEIYLTRNALPGDTTNHEEHGSVVRVVKLGRGKCRFAIQIISAG